MKLNNYHKLILLSVLSGSAQAANVAAEAEPNNTLNTAQRITVPADGLTINAVLGNVLGAAVDDLDFYSFSGQAGDVVTMDIDGGMGGSRSVDTVMAVFDSNGMLLRVSDDAYSADEGSISVYDARIDLLSLPATGVYVVGVSNSPRYFNEGGSVRNPDQIDNGDYSLVITGVTSPAGGTGGTTNEASAVQQINIDIKPGHNKVAKLNPKAKGKIKVAILSSSEFNALDTDVRTLTFGATGDEQSLKACKHNDDDDDDDGDDDSDSERRSDRHGDKHSDKRGRKDVNKDGLPDLVCYFDNQKARFVTGTLEATLRGKLKDGTSFEGRDSLKVLAEKRKGH